MHNFFYADDGRRLNVALTRARFALKILGNAATLASSTMWSDLAKDAKDRGCYLEGAALFPDLALPPASRSDPYKNKGSMKQAARFKDVVDYDVEHSSKWRIVLTKSALSDLEGLAIEKQLALRNSLAAFAGGHNGAQQQKTDGIKGCPTFIKRFKFGDRFIIWTVLVVPKKPKLGVDITATLYHYQQVICVWSISTEKSVKYIVRAVRIACEEFSPEYLTFCEKVEIRKKKALPVFFSTSIPLAPAL
jgi:hypothetical protein